MKKKIIILSASAIICIALVICLNAFATDGYSSLPGPKNAKNIAATQLECAENSMGKSNNAVKAVDSDINTAWKSSKKMIQSYLHLKKPSHLIRQ